MSSENRTIEIEFEVQEAKFKSEVKVTWLPPTSKKEIELLAYCQTTEAWECVGIVRDLRRQTVGYELIGYMTIGGKVVKIDSYEIHSVAVAWSNTLEETMEKAQALLLETFLKF